MCLHRHNALSKRELKQWRDVTSRGVSGRLMRQFSDSGAAPEMVRKPLPSANYHLVRFIWQLGTIDRPASLCMTGRQKNQQIFGESGSPLFQENGRENETNNYASFRFLFWERQTRWVSPPVLSSFTLLTPGDESNTETGETAILSCLRPDLALVATV